VKIAAQTGRLADCVPLLDLAGRTGPEKLVVIGMGDHGIATRVLAARFGSLWTYAGALREVGQLSAPSLVEDFGFRSLSDATRVYGIAGGSVVHSVSPAMHNAAFRAAHIDAVYLPLPAVDADDFVMFGKAVGISGASVTIPHKVTLCDRVDEVSPVARRIGAVNTIRVTDGRWIGGNTDASGFLQPLQDSVDLKSTRASVLGAGGASRAVAVALSSSGCSVRVHARQTRQAQDIAAVSGGQVGPWPPEPGSWDLLVNCTPVGMHPRVDESPIPADLLTGGIVYDLVYNPSTTRLLREAAARRCRTIGGLDMLVAQAEEQFHWWTDTKPAAGVMREAALKRLAEFARDENHVV
jgi:shikimate dehydrogenase